MMREIRQVIHAKLHQDGPLRALAIDTDSEQPTLPELIVRYGLALRGTGAHFFPAFMLDDWGNEMRGLKLYKWLRENGDMYPRATLFGFNIDGSEAQWFVREFELYEPYVAYTYPTKDVPLNGGTLVDIGLFADAAVSAPERVKRPIEIKPTLRRSNLKWWKLSPTDFADFNFSLIKQA